MAASESPVADGSAEPAEDTTHVPPTATDPDTDTDADRQDSDPALQPHSLVAALGSVVVSISQRVMRLLQTQGESEAPPPPSPPPASKAPPADASDAAGKKRLAPAAKKDKDRPKSKGAKGATLPEGVAAADGTASTEPAAAETPAAPQFEPLPREQLFFLTLTEASGLTVRLHPNGAVLMAYALDAESARRHLPAFAALETERTVRSSGEVLRVLRSGERQLLRPDGTVARLLSDGSWQTTGFGGTAITVTAEALASAEAAEARAAAEAKAKATAEAQQASRPPSATDDAATTAAAATAAAAPATEADAGAGGGVTATPVLATTRRAVPENVDVTTREDGTTLVGDVHGDHAVQFADGTRITTSRGPDGAVLRRVECLGFPSVEMLSGDAPRLVVTLADGTIAQHEASAGRCTFLHASGASLQLSASGACHYAPRLQGGSSASVSLAPGESFSSSRDSNGTSSALESGLTTGLTTAVPSGLSRPGAARADGNTAPTSRLVSAGLAGVALGDKAPGAEVAYAFNFLTGELSASSGQGHAVSLQQSRTVDSADAEDTHSRHFRLCPKVDADAQPQAELATRHQLHPFIVQRDGVVRRLLRRSEAAAYGRAAELQEGMDIVSRPVEGDMDSTVTTFVQRTALPAADRQAYHAVSVLPPSMQRHVPRPYAESGVAATHVVVRQLCWHPVLSPARRDMLLDNLQAHQEWLAQEEQHLEALGLTDTRNDDEKRRAAAFAARAAEALALLDDQQLLSRYERDRLATGTWIE